MPFDTSTVNISMLLYAVYHVEYVVDYILLNRGELNFVPFSTSTMNMAILLNAVYDVLYVVLLSTMIAFS
jgi:hypothetical protein